MATPAYVPFVDTTPVISQTRQAIVDSARANLIALRDAAVIGREPGWALTVAGPAEEPSIRMWEQGVERLRANLTYVGGYVTNILWDWSNDSGATWSTIATETITYDGSNNQTAGANSSMLSWLWEWIGKLKALRTSFNAHTAATSVHGMGTIATQSSAAVALTGGTINGVSVGVTTKALGVFIQAREVHASVTFGAPTTLNWATAGSFDVTATGSGAVTLAFSNLPPSGLGVNIVLDLTNGGLRTWTYPAGVKWAGGVAPVLTSAGRDILTFYTRDGGTTIHGMLASKDSR